MDFRRLLDGLPDGIVVLGESGVISSVTAPAAALLGPGAVIGARLADLVGDDACGEVSRAVDQMLGGRWRPRGGTTWRIAGPGQRGVDVEVRCSDLSRLPAVGGIVLTLRDVTAERAREDELRYRAWHDPLTGLPNRALFQARAWEAVQAADQARMTAAVLGIDLDDFKIVNDTRGHAAGDELLCHVAGRVAGAVRETDTAARVGGDELGVVLGCLTGPADAAAFAERIVRVLGEPFTLAAGQVRIGASVGIATTADSWDPASILAFADSALYAVKNSGKGGWRFYDASMTVVPRGQGEPSSASPGPGSPETPLNEARLLRALFMARGPLTAPELAARAGVDGAAASRVIARLEAAGSLSAAPGPAARYSLTGPGRAGVSAALAAVPGLLASPGGPGLEG